MSFEPKNFSEDEPPYYPDPDDEWDGECGQWSPLILERNFKPSCVGGSAAARRR